MIYTVTCNPSLDYRMELGQLKPGETNRADAVNLLAGGKGLNVSVVLHHLGMETAALGFVAGFVGNEIELRMEKSGCHCRFVHLEDGCSRINVKLRGTDETTELNAPGPEISAGAQEELLRHLTELVPGDVLILAGSVPPSMPKTVYADWMEQLRNAGLDIIVDATGDTLRQTLSHHPFFVKPNHHELGDLFGVKIKNREDAAVYGKKLLDLGARNVLVSMSSQGAVLCTEDGQVLTQDAASGTVINDVGAGDSMIAGFLTGWLQTHDYREALHLGAAAGAASAFSENLATREEIEAVQKKLPLPQKML